MQDTEAVIAYANGNLEEGIMVVAVAPDPICAGYSEIYLQGDVTYNNFEKLLSSIKWNHSDVYIKCSSLLSNKLEYTRRSPNIQDVRNCSSCLARIFELVNPKVKPRFFNVA